MEKVGVSHRGIPEKGAEMGPGERRCPAPGVGSTGGAGVGEEERGAPWAAETRGGARRLPRPPSPRVGSPLFPSLVHPAPERIPRPGRFQGRRHLVAPVRDGAVRAAQEAERLRRGRR